MKIDSIEFDMFRVRDLTGGNELMLSTMAILLKDNIFLNLGIN